MQFYADTHTHTIACSHAYSTIMENAKYASENNIGCIAMTDHAPKMPDAPHIWHFRNILTVPETLYGVRILRGAEVNLMPDGSIDIEGEDLARQEWVVLSLHPPVYGNKRSIEENTNAYLQAIKNPYIDVIGHSGSYDYPYDYEKTVKAFAQYSKIVEINEHTFDVRPKNVPNCRTIAVLCKKYGVRIAVNSDAHFAYNIGKFPRSIKMLDEIDFPNELIVNDTKEHLDAYLSERKAKIANCLYH